MSDLFLIDRLLCIADNARHVLCNLQQESERQRPDAQIAEVALDLQEKAQSIAHMRVNHVGEICAQSLYMAQAALAREKAEEDFYRQAAKEEYDHLAWCRARLAELGGRPSLLNPLWYAGATAIGLIAASAGKRTNLGFVAQTEQQVEQHVTKHLHTIPQRDAKSRRILEQIRDDEKKHGNKATDLGAIDLPLPVRLAMRCAAKVMTTTARYI